MTETTAREDIVDSLHRLLALDATIKALEEEREIMWQAVRIELGSMDEPLVDFERGIVATLKEKKLPASIDLVTLAKHQDKEAHIIEAARSGVLSARLTPLRTLKGKTAWADALLAAEMPGGVTYELKIERTK